MASSSLYRLGAVACWLNAIILVVSDALPAGTFAGTLNLVAGLCHALALPALYLRQRRESGLLGVVGYAANMVGLVLIAGAVFAAVYVLEPFGDALGDQPIGGNPFAGFTIVAKSPYLLGIALFVVLLASVNTFLYFAQLRIVSETFTDPVVRTQIFSRLDYTVQSLTIILQVMFTGRIASRFGVGMLLTAVPLIMVGGLALLGGFHTFAVLAVVMVSRRVGEYAFVRPGREMLWSAVDTETKYKAKNLVDVPVYRGGDALVAQVDKGLAAAGMSAATVAFIGAGVAAAWAVNGYLLGRSRKDLGPQREKR